MKLNCEGGEILILRDLIQSRQIHTLNSIYIDFDSRKIPSQQQEETNILAEMKACEFNRYVSAQVLARLQTYFFSKRRKVARRIFSNSKQAIWFWLIRMNDVARIRKLNLADKIIRRMPLLIWQRIFRIEKLINLQIRKS